jgi:hypothetical protein
VAIRRFPVEAVSFQQYVNQLEHKKLVLLGRGRTGQVYQHPTMPHVAVKVFRKSSTTQGDEWLSYCQAHPSKWLPKIYGFQELNIKVTKQDVIDDIEEEGTGLLKHMICFMEKLETMTEKELTSLIASNGVSDVIERDVKYVEPTWRLDTTTLYQKDEAFIRSIQKAQELSRKSWMDLRLPNLMRRGNQLVLVDPVA